MRLAALCVLGLLCACGTADPERYQLAPAQSDALLTHKHGVLFVTRPDAENGLDSDRIQLEAANGEVTAIQNALWAEPLDIMLQKLLAQDLERSGTFAHVITDDDDGKPTALLRTTITRFTFVDNGTPHVEVSINAELADAATGNHLISKTISASAPVQEVRLHVIIPAFESALTECLKQLTNITRSHP